MLCLSKTMRPHHGLFTLARFIHNTFTRAMQIELKEVATAASLAFEAKGDVEIERGAPEYYNPQWKDALTEMERKLKDMSAMAYDASEASKHGKDGVRAKVGELQVLMKAVLHDPAAKKSGGGEKEDALAKALGKLEQKVKVIAALARAE